MEEVSLRLITLKNMLYSSKEKDNVFQHTSSVPKKDELKQGFWAKRDPYIHGGESPAGVAICSGIYPYVQLRVWSGDYTANC